MDNFKLVSEEYSNGHYLKTRIDKESVFVDGPVSFNNKIRFQSVFVDGPAYFRDSSNLGPQVIIETNSWGTGDENGIVLNSLSGTKFEICNMYTDYAIHGSNPRLAFEGGGVTLSSGSENNIYIQLLFGEIRLHAGNTTLSLNETKLQKLIQLLES